MNAEVKQVKQLKGDTYMCMECNKVLIGNQVCDCYILRPVKDFWELWTKLDPKQALVSYNVLGKELTNLEYFDAPASSGHHLNYTGGLFEHSKNVVSALNRLFPHMANWSRPQSPYIIGLFHDLCKCDDYIFTQDGWKRNPEAKAGHGEKSLEILSRFIVLTPQEELCIRYHMGAYNTNDWQLFDQAIREYPEVLYTHTADMYASKIIEKYFKKSVDKV